MRLSLILSWLLLNIVPVLAQDAISTSPTPPGSATTNSLTGAGSGTNAPPRALPVNPAELNASAPMAVAGGVNIHWYGHGFIYLTSSVGIRCAFDPFGSDTVHYSFPAHLAADFVLVTHESEDAGAADQLFGNPLIFRSVMAVGFNRANGIAFYGVPLQKDPYGQSVADTAYTIKFDGIRFCYLGQMYTPLLGREKQQLGKCDVLFLPVGDQNLSVQELNQVAKDLGARMIIPVSYKTDKSGVLALRTLDDYLSATAFPVRKIDTEEIVVTHDSLPAQPTIYALKSP